MSSRRISSVGDISDSSSGKVNSPKVDQIGHGLADISIDTKDGTWEVSVRKSKNRAGNSSTAKSWAPQNTAPIAWGQQPGIRSESNSSKSPATAWPPLGSAGKGNFRPQASSRPFPNHPAASQPANAAPLSRGWNWNARSGASTHPVEAGLETHPVEDVENDIDDDGSDVVESDDELLSDDFDSDASDQSFESRKKNKWLKAFFEMLDRLTVEEINEPARQWHCPACQGGPGAIDWYRGLQPLMTHAKTKGSKRVKLHRELAELLDEELRRRGTSVIPAGEAFGQWEGLKNAVKDREIVWPPMVVIMNTKLEKNEDKWTGMGSQELLDYFSSYAAAKARHSYGPQGHRGMSMLIFESSAIGYLEAERLDDHFQEQGTHRDAWNRAKLPKDLFYPGGKRLLYGFMAEKQDLDVFNQHSPGKSKLKFEMRSYQEMVVSQLRQMSEDNQQLIWFKDRVAKEKKISKAFEESFEELSKKLRRTLEENRIVKQRSKMHHEQIEEEIEFQEKFYKDQLKLIYKARDAKEDAFERVQQAERQKMKQSEANLATSSSEDEIARFTRSQEKEIEEFVRERDKLTKIHEEERGAMKKRHFEEEVELEKKFDAQLNQLMEKYMPPTGSQ